MTLRVACLGAGYFARFHHDAWARIPGAALAATADRDPARGADYADLGAMLDGARPDNLDIVIPPAGHLDAIRSGIAAGVAMIICQKPFCTTREEAETATALAEAAGAPVPAIGFAFSAQRSTVPLPSEATDRPLDRVVTELG